MQHDTNGRDKNANIIKVQQKSDKLLIPQALLHHMAKAGASIQESKLHMNKLMQAMDPPLNAVFLMSLSSIAS